MPTYGTFTSTAFLPTATDTVSWDTSLRAAQLSRDTDLI
jgi:hypothetical protein